MQALLDFDIYCYRVACVSENEEESTAKFRIDEMVQNTLQEVQATSWRGFLTDSENNFRKKVYPEYKVNRTQPKPKHLEYLRQYVTEEYGAELAVGMEADDYLGIYQTNDVNTIICSIDKDLLQVPGLHYNFVRKEFIEVNEDAGNRNFYKQLLKGDASDHLKGVEGIGEKKADKILLPCKNEKEMFDTVRTLYDNDEYFIMSGRCLWIRRFLEDDWRDRFNELDRREG